jgi:hypothetical protein
MRTIHSILEYNLTEREKIALFEAWIINGIGGEWQNIEAVLRANIELLPWYDNNKADSLFKDIQELAVEHDIQFKFKMWFRYSNYKFAKKLFHILHWSSFWKRLAVAIIAYILLTRYWKKFYNPEKSI